MSASPAPAAVTAPDPPIDERRRYEDALVRAMGHAERYLPRDQALEIAHDVASEMMTLSPEQATPALIYVAVTSRLRNQSRAAHRRAAAEGAYQEMRSSVAPAWTRPDATFEVSELRQRIRNAVAAMPPGMRDVFLLVRDEELSYKEAARRLGIGVGTVHTQLSRANALLRDCIARYHADPPFDHPGRKHPR